MKKLITVLLILLLIAGCSKQAVEQDNEIEDIDVPDVQEKNPMVSREISAELIENQNT